MKKILALCLSLVIVSPVFTGCEKDDDSSAANYQESRNTWLTFKNKSGNTYTYLTSFGSVFGFGSKGSISVSNGVIVRRTYELSRYDQTVKTVLESWTETGTQIGTHSNGIELLTLDDIYEKAKMQWLSVDRSKNRVVFEADNNGMISSCGFVPNGCMDDCFNGIRITSITEGVIPF
jgi:hypothetical protein